MLHRVWSFLGSIAGGRLWRQGSPARLDPVILPHVVKDAVLRPGVADGVLPPIAAAITISPPRTIKVQWTLPQRTGRPSDSRHKTAAPAAIIDRETSSGAITGPTHGTGNRNRMSQVPSDAGQPSSSFRNT